jgi:hypothetical protein
MLVKCMYCDADNDAVSTGGYCESCGKKLPSSALMKPRRTLGGDAPETPGRPYSEPLPPRNRSVSEGLFATAIVHLFAGGLFLILGGYLYSPEPPKDFAPNVLSWAILPTLLIAALGVLARWIPMPAVLLALGLGLAWVAATFLISAPLAGGWLLVDVVLFAMLLWAVWRGLRPEKRAAG